MAADSYGFDSILLPSGYVLGIDSVAFAAAVATQTRQIHLLLAVRMGEMVLPQLARQLATIDQISAGRLTLNVISSDVPGETLAGPPRYRRTLESMAALRALMSGQHLDMAGEFVNLHIDPPRVATSGPCPPFYFGGLSEEAKECAAAGADVYLMWPDTPTAVATVIGDMRARAERWDRKLRFGWRSHVIVRETEAEARSAAQRLLSKLDPEVGREIRSRSLDSASVGVARQAELRSEAETTATWDGTCGPGWGGPGAAPGRPSWAIPTRSGPPWVSSPRPGWSRSSCPAIPTWPSATCSPGTSWTAWTTLRWQVAIQPVAGRRCSRVPARSGVAGL